MTKSRMKSTRAPSEQEPSERSADLAGFDCHAKFYETHYRGAIMRLRNPMERVYMAECRQEAGDWSDAPMPDIVFSLIQHGRGRARADLGAGRFESEFRPGEMLVMAPGGGSSIRRDRRHELIGMEIPYARLLALAGGEAGLPENGDFGRIHSAPVDDPLCAAILRGLWSEVDSYLPGGRLFIESVLLTLAARLGRLASRPPRSTRAVGGLATRQLRRVMAIIESSPADAHSLEDLAREVGLSSFHFARAFKRSVGAPPHRYQIQIRIDRAKALLADTNLPVDDIAAAVGYEDPSYFARAFAREVETTPARYRRALRA